MLLTLAEAAWAEAKELHSRADEAILVELAEDPGQLPVQKEQSVPTSRLSTSQAAHDR